MFPAGNTLPVHVADTQGIFARNGLRVEVTEGQDVPLFMAAMAKGQYDIAMSVPNLVLIGAEKHLDLQIVASTAQQSRERPNAVWIARDPSITQISQLKGRTIGVPSLTGIIVDAVVYLLQRSGVDRHEVKFVQLPFPVMGDQLQAGHVDAVVATLPYSTAIEARGFHVHDDVIVEAVRDASGGTADKAITTVWSTTREFARQHPATISAWRTSLSEAIEVLNGDQARARSLMLDWLKIPADVLARAPLPDWTVDITPADLEPYVTISRSVGSIDAEPDVAALVWQGP
jgi:ABC-type nitrate/sulfonate/bicarbonate transport system substrate-binding protein